VWYLTLKNKLLFELAYGVGEFGVFHRGKLLRKQGRNKPGFVAVKTMRGMSDNEIRYWVSVSELHTSVFCWYGMYAHRSWLAQLAIGIMCHYCHHVHLLVGA